jgi:hypothetical protein
MKWAERMGADLKSVYGTFLLVIVVMSAGAMLRWCLDAKTFGIWVL